MKVLVVTGKLAEKEVRNALRDTKVEVDVFVADVDVASFVTPKHLEKLDLSRYDLVLLPGNARGNWKELEEKTGTKIRLGSIHAADLKKVLENIDKIELSHTVPACKLLSSIMAEEIMKLVESDVSGVELPAVAGDVVIGEGRLKIVAEIVDASEMGRDELEERIEYYVRSGADVIDLGMPVDCSVEKAVRAVRIALDCCNAVSVDTFNPKIIERCVKEGVHMIMSLSHQNLKAIDSIDDQAIVMVSRNVEELLKLVEFARKRGKNNVIADCILDSPLSFYASLERYAKYRRLDERTPMLFGAGNVTELCDADSIGINAILAFLAEEVGANALFTTEASCKTRGSVRELRVASYMARAARLRKTPPKDLGFSLLVVKEKTRKAESFDGEAIEAKDYGFVRDPKGDFRISTYGRDVVAIHDSGIAVKGDAERVSKTLIKMNLISRLDHAAYIGRELMKAEIAARLQKSYVQNEDLDFGIY